MGRYKIYGSRAFAKAVDDYFHSISRRVPVEKPESKCAGETEGGGEEEMSRLEYISAPSLVSLCLYLNISQSTLERYARQEEYAKTVADARAKIRAYLENELMTRTKGSTHGLEFLLSQNFGMTPKAEGDIGERAAEVLRVSALSPAEKLELIRRAAAELCDGMKP